ncbi:MAG: hypothetical protein D6820_11430 [Lentisphaerae bacterium]|nr:MAG: hypothetical protein D6820_11430 [Lentisphaerota bacterium]
MSDALVPKNKKAIHRFGCHIIFVLAMVVISGGAIYQKYFRDQVIIERRVRIHPMNMWFQELTLKTPLTLRIEVSSPQIDVDGYICNKEEFQRWHRKLVAEKGSIRETPPPSLWASLQKKQHRKDDLRLPKGDYILAIAPIWKKEKEPVSCHYRIIKRAASRGE